MNYFLILIIAISLATLTTVIVGVAKLAIGDKVDYKKSNKMMLMRVALQALVVALIAIAYFIK